ncbi:MAG TPA: peptidoglycan DD-metalloendopeptidase family protein [Woeseiaceae bacterium]|nr:peptidoglycan DD-metalloendopeptidase family protein [Woeseiaceae bacterium]
MTGGTASTRTGNGFRRAWFRNAAAVLAVAIIAAACGSPPRVEQMRDYHIVRSGETLFTIAWRYGKDYRELARWNDLGDGSLIYPGQLIKLYAPPGSASTRGQPRRSADQRNAGTRAPASALPEVPSEPPPAWAWPTPGPVVVGFGERPGTGTGVLIGGKSGQPVRAAAGGRVVYSGSGLIGYGQLIIVKHNDTYLSAYGHNASLLVQEGETVGQGQRIATMGEGPGREPRLHFEIRQNGKPVDPRQYLPER